eukprot:3078752-Pyramimonas_sp.AAC.1
MRLEPTTIIRATLLNETAVVPPGPDIAIAHDPVNSAHEKSRRWQRQRVAALRSEAPSSAAPTPL